VNDAKPRATKACATAGVSGLARGLSGCRMACVASAKSFARRRAVWSDVSMSVPSVAGGARGGWQGIPAISVRARGALAAILCASLAACGAREDAPAAAADLRDASAPVGAQVDVTAARLSGEWQVVQGRGVPPGARVSFSPDTLTVAGQSYPLTEEAPGRFRAGGRALWVHWLDADARTAAMGDPDGAWVFVIDRTGAPGERLDAALSILDWYGYAL
jgi:apolipoprotein D and lipocalin family protein